MMLRTRTICYGAVTVPWGVTEVVEKDGDTAFGWEQRPDRHTSLLFDVFVLGQRTGALVDAAMQDAGLRPDEYAAYSVVFEMGSITLTEMARELGMPLTTVADHVRTMVARGHLRKKPHRSDGRASMLSLTPSGLRAHRKASRSFERAHRALAEALQLEESEARTTIQAVAAAAERGLVALQNRRRAGGRQRRA
jgi:DNA-binding MarR family transcriptional regulator